MDDKKTENEIDGFNPEDEPGDQLALQIDREYQQDRNHAKGGRSFYFFDFDDNVAYLTTPIFIFHKETREELSLSSGEFAQNHRRIGKSGEFKDYEIDFDDPVSGSFRSFRDQDLSLVDRLVGKRQSFVNDLEEALQKTDLEWKGPSWNCFYHAVFNHRPLAIITARGHAPSTIRDGVSLLVERGFLPNQPNYLDIYPVSHPETRYCLGDKDEDMSVAELKKNAIKESVREAFRRYKQNPYHRFGMSDDDPKNVELIIEAMRELKNEFAENSFFVFDSSGGDLIKREVMQNQVVSEKVETGGQMSFF